MKISDIRIRPIRKEDTNIKAIASLTVEDSIIIHDIKLRYGREGFYISMPNRKNLEGEKKDIVHPANSETRKMLCDLITAEYEKVTANDEKGEE